MDTVIPKTVNPDLQKERDNATFNVEDFALWWHGGAEKLKFKRELDSFLLDDLDDDAFLFHYKSYEDVYSRAIVDAIKCAKKLQILQEKYNPGGEDIWPCLYSNPETIGAMPAGNTFMVPYKMSVVVLRHQGTDEQFEEFGERAKRFEIAPTYAQTELGHGTYLKGLQTRADYDRKTDEFVLNTPTLSAYKWWPGSLGHSCSYCIVVANLYIDNDPKGINMFMVQIRDEDTHMPLPGIDVGDIGHRMGFWGVNNGFLGLKDVRIPRKNMLMRNAQVHRDGTYVQSPLSVLAYFSMVSMRISIVYNNAWCLSTAATIATRYSAVRRQSPINPNEPEPQIMDHVTQQMKLFPEIAASIAYKLSFLKLNSYYDQISADIKRGEYSRLGEMHALACAIKVLCTSDSASGVEQLRLACGGHGYLTSSNMSNWYVFATAACTYEGENTVLLLQVGRFLMKSYRQALDGKPLARSVAYLEDFTKQSDFGKWTGTWKNIIRALQFAAANKTRSAFEHLNERIQSGQTEGEAANNTGIELTQAAKLHGYTFVVATFLEEVTGPNASSRNLNLNKVLEDLLELFLVNTALRNMHDILRFIHISEADLRSLQSRLEQTLKALRPNAVAICDGFDYHDKTLGSTLGSYDGNVYERLYVAAKQNPLNKEPVPKIFHTHLKPFMKAKM